MAVILDRTRGEHDQRLAHEIRVALAELDAAIKRARDDGLFVRLRIHREPDGVIADNDTNLKISRIEQL